MSGLYELESEGDQSIFSVMLFLLAFSPKGGHKLQSFTQQMQCSVAEFISVMGDEFASNKAFMQEIRRRTPLLPWSIRFKIEGSFIGDSSLEEKIAILNDASQVLETAPLTAQFNAFQACYDEFKQLVDSPKNDEKEEVIADEEATQKMETEALDGNTPDREADVVTRSEEISRDLEAYLNVLDVVTRLLSQDDTSVSVLPLPEDLVKRIEGVLGSVVNQLDTLSNISSPQVESLRQHLLAAALETTTALLPYFSYSVYITVWPLLQTHMTLGAEVTQACVKGMWAWSQVATQNASFNDTSNPVCFPDQITPVLQLLSTSSGDIVVQIVHTLSSLLGLTKPSDFNRACLTEVCRQVVLALDNPNNNSNAEILGAVLDFMMTM